MNQPLVSLIIPVYNVEQYLRECLDSVCNQTYKNLEIICIDDGSTDCSLTILKEYAQKDSRIILLSQPNAGQAAARNKGLKIASGEWLGGVDSDDYLELDAIEKCISYATSDIDVIHFATRLFNENYETINESWIEMRLSGKIKISDTLIPQIQPHFVDKLWRSSLIRHSGVQFPIGCIFEDLCFTWSILTTANNIYCLPEKLYHYRRRAGSTMKRLGKGNKNPKILDFLKISDTCLSFWKKENIRQKFGYSGPSYIELEILNRSRDRITKWAADEYLHAAWEGIRLLIKKYNLESRLVDFPDLALYYYIPPYASDVLLRRINKNREEIIRNQALVFNYSRLLWRYRLTQFKVLFSWGKRKVRLVERKTKLKALLREARYNRKETLSKLYAATRI